MLIANERRVTQLRTKSGSTLRAALKISPYGVAALAKVTHIDSVLRRVWRNFEQQRGSRLKREQPLIILRIALFCAFFAGLPASAEETLPQRWVSAGSALSEWIAVLGGQAKLVGVDSTSQFPQALTALPGIGYQRQLSAEGILSLRPDILVGSEEMGPPPVLAQLKAAGLRIETFSAKPELEALADNLTRLGHLLGAEEKAARLLMDYRLKLAERRALINEIAQSGRQAPKVLLLLSHAGTRPMAAGADTAADWLIKQAGGENLATHQGYKAISSEALLAMNPEVLIFTDRSLPSVEAMQAQLADEPALAGSRAAQSGRLIALDPALLVGGLGARLPEELSRLISAFYAPPAQ